MIDSAPHLTTKIPFVIPCTNTFTTLYYYMGSLMYYWIYKYFSPNTKTVFRPPYMINRQELVEIFPNMNPKFTNGIVY
jgi:glycerol-3-phosphate dehydrogenase